MGAAGSQILLSARSGHAALRHRLSELGYTFGDEEFERVYQSFLEVADRKKEVYDEDLESIVRQYQRDVTAIWGLDAVQVSCGFPLTPTATVTMTDETGQAITDCAYGIGPIDAVYKAVDKIVRVGNELSEYSVKAVTRGIDALGEVSVRVKAENGEVFTGRGSDGDIIVSSTKAYINALNRLLAAGRARAAK